MAWWMWTVVAWATLASFAAWWLAVTVYRLRSELMSPPEQPIELPWAADGGAGDVPLFRFDPEAIAGSIRDRVRGRSVRT